MMILAGLTIAVGLAGSASASALTGSQTTRSAASASALKTAPAERAASVSSSQTKPASLPDVARAQQVVLTSEVHAAVNYWYSWQYYGNVWVASYYDGPYYGYGWSPYYVIYDEFYLCTTGETGCLRTDTYTSQYYGDYYGYSAVGTWTYYGPAGFTPSHQLVGYGPYVGGTTF
jgi:hypothetical protein